MRASASRMAISTLPNFDVMMARHRTKAIMIATQEIENNALRVVSACTLKPRMSLKSVSPLLPPNPKLLRKKPSISAKVSAWVMIDR